MILTLIPEITGLDLFEEARSRGSTEARKEEAIMLSALFSGVSGLQNHQIELNVIGNNIANINTVGFKGGRTTFAETLVQRISGAQGPSGSYGGRNPY